MPSATAKKNRPTRKRPWSPTALAAMDERLREMGGRFKGLASKVALAELEQIQVDGSAMLDRAFDQMEMFLVNGEAALTAAKAEQRRQGSA